MFTGDKIMIEPVICGIGKVFRVTFGTDRGVFHPARASSDVIRTLAFHVGHAFIGGYEYKGNNIKWLHYIKILHIVAVDDIFQKV